MPIHFITNIFSGNIFLDCFHLVEVGFFILHADKIGRLNFIGHGNPDKNLSFLSDEQILSHSRAHSTL